MRERLNPLEVVVVAICLFVLSALLLPGMLAAR